MSANERAVASVDRAPAHENRGPVHERGEQLAGRVLADHGVGLYAYAYRLTLSETIAAGALRHAAVTLRSGSPKVADEQSALDIARLEIGRHSLDRQDALVTQGAPVLSLREEDLLRTGFHRRLHSLPTLERQCWLLRHTGGHTVDLIAGLLAVTAEQVRAALSSAATTLVAGELADEQGDPADHPTG